MQGWPMRLSFPLRYRQRKAALWLWMNDVVKVEACYWFHKAARVMVMTKVPTRTMIKSVKCHLGLGEGPRRDG